MRKRDIKPSFFQNEELVELPALTRLLYIGLWCMADRKGRFEYRPKKIRMCVLPGDDLDIDAALQSLEEAGFITRYEAGGMQCAYIKNFEKHQNIHPDEKRSLLPAPPLAACGDGGYDGAGGHDGGGSPGGGWGSGGGEAGESQPGSHDVQMGNNYSGGGSGGANNGKDYTVGSIGIGCASGIAAPGANAKGAAGAHAYANANHNPNDIPLESSWNQSGSSSSQLDSSFNQVDSSFNQLDSSLSQLLSSGAQQGFSAKQLKSSGAPPGSSGKQLNSSAAQQKAGAAQLESSAAKQGFRGMQQKPREIIPFPSFPSYTSYTSKDQNICAEQPAGAGSPRCSSMGLCDDYYGPPAKRAHAQGGAPVMSLPLKDSAEYKITAGQAREWAELYPKVDVPQQLRCMRAWLIANPRRRKGMGEILRFVNGWLAKNQGCGGAYPYHFRAPPDRGMSTRGGFRQREYSDDELEFLISSDFGLAADGAAAAGAGGAT